MMRDAEMEARIVAQRERVLEEIKTLDSLYCEAGIFAEPRQSNDFPTHILVLASWHRMESVGPDAVGITDYRITDMPLWQCLGLIEAAGEYFRTALVTGTDGDD